MSIDEMQNENEEEEEDFGEWEEDDRCSCCGLPFDLCSWSECYYFGQVDGWNNESQLNDCIQFKMIMIWILIVVLNFKYKIIFAGY